MKRLPGRHATEDELEHYSLDEFLPDETFWDVAEHLHDCRECQLRLDKLAFEAKHFHDATARWGAHSHLNWQDRLRTWFAVPGVPALAGAAVFAAVLLAVLVLRPQTVVVTFSIPYRAADTQVAIAPTGKRITFVLDTSGLEGKFAKVELVDAAGRQLYSTTPEYRASRLSLTLRESPPPGRYLVRLYGGPAAELLREYGLELRRP